MNKSNNTSAGITAKQLNKLLKSKRCTKHKHKSEKSSKDLQKFLEI
jgi:hypothetical protein